jgi:DNA replication and repair protein RecF
MISSPRAFRQDRRNHTDRRMPTLEKIVISDWRNIALQELEFSPKINCISGDNGSGKTNLLEAVHCLSMTKCFSSTSEKYNYRHGTRSYAISGMYLMENGLRSRFSLQCEDGGEKKLKRDEKQYTRISEHLGVLPIVTVSPSDVTMVSESGEERRRFANAVLSQLDREYLSNMQQYNRILQQRNRLLKSQYVDTELLGAFDAGLAKLAGPISARRREFAEALRPAVQNFYSQLSGGREEVSLSYSTDLDKAPAEELFAASRERDLVLHYTSTGIQRDDFVFTLDGHPIRRCGSQGQQKSFLVSLKFAQYELMKQRCGFAPLLLLDDLFDKLDMSRVANLLEMVASSDFGQIFLTDSNKVRIAGIVDTLTSERAYFECSQGTFTKA